MREASEINHWYVLYTIVSNQEKVCATIRREGLNAFLPRMEYYRRDSRSVETKPMFPGYIFIKEPLSQEVIDDRLSQLQKRRGGFPRQLKEDGTSALRPDEIEMFTNLLDEFGILRMSKAYLKDGRAVITEGPLAFYQDSIIKVDRHNKLAWLELKFMDKNLQAGIEIQKVNANAPGSDQSSSGVADKYERNTEKYKKDKEDKRRDRQGTKRKEKKRGKKQNEILRLRTGNTEDGSEDTILKIDLEELKSRMMRL